jgi:hypothetical protein
MKEKNVFKKMKYFVSAVFSTDAKFPLPQNKFLRVKKRGNLASVLKTAETKYFIFLNTFFSFIIKKQFA